MSARVKGSSEFMALNKIDSIRKPAVLAQIAAWSQSGDFAEVVPVSARTGEQVDRLLDVMEAQLPAGPPYFPPETLTDLPEQFGWPDQAAGLFQRAAVDRFSRLVYRRKR